MLKVDVNLAHVPASPEQLIALFESINMPLVSIPNVGTAATQAFVIGLRADAAGYMVMVCLRQADNDVNLVYVSDPLRLNSEQYRFEESEGLRFAESMGFLMNDHAVHALSAPLRSDLWARTPIFRRQASTLDLLDVEVEDLPLPELLPEGPDPMFGGLPLAMVQGSPVSGASDPAMKAVPRPTARPTAVGGLERRAPEPALDPAALERLGRFLSTFVVILAWMFGCASMHPSGELNPELETQVAIAEQHLAQGSFADAIEVLNKVLEQAPKSHVALHDLGLAYFYLGKASEAEGFFRRAIDVNPKYAEAKNSLGALLIQNRQCQEAAELLRTVTQDIFYRTPEYAEENLAKAEACLGKTEDALRRLESLVLRRPRFCRGYLTLADVSFEAKVMEVTIRACDHFAAQCEEPEDVKKFVSPEHACLCYLRKGLAYAALGDVESARQSLASCESDGAYGRECQRSLKLLEGSTNGGEP